MYFKCPTFAKLINVSSNYNLSLIFEELARLIPYESYTLASPLSTEKLLLKLLDNTLGPEEYVSESDERVFSFGLKAWSKPYWGYIRKDSFELERLINYRNLGNPKIFGVIKPKTSGTVIQIKMRPESSTIVFMCFALLICFYALGFSVVQSLKTKHMHVGVIVSSGILVLAYLLLLVPFKAETIKSKKFLSELLENVNFHE